MSHKYLFVGGGTESTVYYFANSELIGKKNNAGTRSFIHADHLGSTSVVTNSGGTLVEATKYDPWGEIAVGGTESKFLYTGQEHDSETGLNYYNARYYDPYVRRFTQPDDIIQNVYNPLRYTDPTGYFVFAIPAAYWAGAAVVTGAVYLSTPQGQAQVQATLSAAITGAKIAATSITTAVTSATKSISTSLNNNKPATYSSSQQQSGKSGGSPQSPNGNSFVQQLVATGSVAVYQAAANGQKYYGITKDTVQRQYQHGQRFSIAAIEKLENLSRYDARAVEQALIERAGGVDALLNKINSISPKNPIYNDAIKRGNEILDMVGIY